MGIVMQLLGCHIWLLEHCYAVARVVAGTFHGLLSARQNCKSKC